MLYLKLCAADSPDGASRRVPLGEQTAIWLERALLTGDREQRRSDLGQALAIDSDFAGWALRVCESRQGRTINRTEEAADWLSGCLETELSTALDREEPYGHVGEVEWRLHALLSKLGDYERRLNDFDRRLEREKLASLKELAYGASHEINNPLANIAARAQTLLADEPDPERARKLTAIHRQAMRAHEMISDLMLFARPPKLEIKPIDLRPLANRVVEERRPFVVERGIDLACEVTDETVVVMGDETQLGVAIDALVRNALEAVGDGGRVRVNVRQAASVAEPLAEICVCDDGPGISDEVRQHMFDPFFSGREAGRGLGFGLSKCWRIVTDHGGRVIVNRPTCGGMEISILIPLRIESAAE